MPQKIKQYTKSFFKVKEQLRTQGSSVLSSLHSAITLHQQGQLGQAEAIYRQLLNIDPKNADALHLIGLIAHQTGNHQSAVDLIGNAIEVNPNVANYYSNLATALIGINQFDAAILNCHKAIELNINFAEAYTNRGLALRELKKFEAAIESYDKAIALNPNLAEAYSNRAIVLLELKQFEAALTNCNEAIDLQSDFANAYSNRGIALQSLKQFEAAVSSYDKAIALKPDYAEAYNNKGSVLEELKRFEIALFNYKTAIKLNSSIEYLFGTIQHIKMQICDWRDFSKNVSELRLKIQALEKASPCLTVLAFKTTLSEQRKVAEIWSGDKHPYNPSLGPILNPARQTRIRIGYYSADFHNHATSYLLAELFELHDKSKFELIGFSFGPDKQDEMRTRVSQALDRFIDVTAISDKAVAQLSRELGIDIAIDLKGVTQDNRLGIFSFKAAPIQVSYLGYPGTLGASYIDYLIADKTLIPKESQEYYSEKIVFLPNSYQVNDRHRAIASTQFTKQELGLPQDSFVFCCFNNNFKITPDVFDTWVRILKAVDASVLWLLEDNQIAATNLQKEAALRGLDPSRLVFAKRMTLPEHLARHKAADLFLDTLPYNAHTTASDALWAGLPVLTCLGESFASRVAASLLNAIGLPELVTETQPEYEAFAIELATNPIKLKSIKHKLENNRLATPLFDTPQFAKHIEAAYLQMYERYMANLPPDHIYIDASSCPVNQVITHG